MRVLLQNRHDASISTASSLEPGRICMTMSFSQTSYTQILCSQILRPRPMPMLDARFAL